MKKKIYFLFEIPLLSTELKIKEKQGEHERERKGMVTIKKGVLPLARAESYRVNCKYFPRGTTTGIHRVLPTLQVSPHPVGFKGTQR